ncbi:MAG: hypothetical protein M3021_04650 [Actinomycetota bacterium]|nr:hypothetical protein [Actinomycetota bacterium]
MVDPTNPALAPLAVLVGEWQVDLTFPAQPHPFRTRASCAWREEGAFLAIHMGDRAAGPPYSIAVVGRDDTTGLYTALYYDDRGVSRIYLMSLEGCEWRQWRDAPGFAQRFVGTLSADSQTITARWEKSTDGTTWEHDFDLIYTRLP